MNHNLNSTKPRRFRTLLWLSLAALIFVCAVFLIASKPSSDYHYSFLTADHPIDVISDARGRWFYYMPAPVTGGAPKLADSVRNELLPLGFTEDLSNKPWFRFVKGDREVIVCNHDEIATDGSVSNTHVIHETRPAVPQSTKYAVVWIHQPGSNSSGVAAFQIKKLVFRW